MQLDVLTSIKSISAATWNSLHDGNYPFVQHEFLLALENNACVGEAAGWVPNHFLLKEGDRIIAAVPAYIKTHSYGEFVFDWAWADAYQNHGYNYYPKLVVAIPFTPASGPRFLCKRAEENPEILLQLANTIKEFCLKTGLSGAHWLFTLPQQNLSLTTAGYQQRLGCQYHWHNQNYQNFDHFLDQLNSRKRKKINRERRSVAEQSLQLNIKTGAEISEQEWTVVHDYYCRLYDRKWGQPSLTLPFFIELGKTMADKVAVVFARLNNRIVACAYLLIGSDTLYGRYWGCAETFHSLHFETCYYQGIEYCIQRGLSHFEPGAQGEHKVARGFVPTETYSAHWLADPSFNDAIARHVKLENSHIRQYIENMQQFSPYKLKP